MQLTRRRTADLLSRAHYHPQYSSLIVKSWTYLWLLLCFLSHASSLFKRKWLISVICFHFCSKCAYNLTFVFIWLLNLWAVICFSFTRSYSDFCDLVDTLSHTGDRCVSANRDVYLRAVCVRCRRGNWRSVCSLLLRSSEVLYRRLLRHLVTWCGQS